jgi:hypothetical protein
MGCRAPNGGWRLPVARDLGAIFGVRPTLGAAIVTFQGVRADGRSQPTAELRKLDFEAAKLAFEEHLYAALVPLLVGVCKRSPT